LTSVVLGELSVFEEDDEEEEEAGPEAGEPGAAAGGTDDGESAEASGFAAADVSVCGAGSCEPETGAGAGS
jgi:hypothetical protein